MERTMIAWNFPNWITVLLMAAAGYLVLALVSQLVLHRGPGNAAASGNPDAGSAAVPGGGY